MRLTAYRRDGAPRLGVLEDAGVREAPYSSLNELLADGLDGLVRLRELDVGLEPFPRDSELPIQPRPTKMLFCGLNYRDHVAENPDVELPPYPFIFAKLPSSIIGPGDAAVIPNEHSLIDYEVELAVVIGRRARNLSVDEALDVVFGYTVVNDLTARDIQTKDQQITMGKGLDTFCPMSSDLVLAEEISNPSDLRLWSEVNGEVRQDASTADMIFGVAEIVAYLTTMVTLEPGDVIATGTPSGVGYFLDPPALLQPGDEVVVHVDTVGSVRTHMVAGW